MVAHPWLASISIVFGIPLFFVIVTFAFCINWFLGLVVTALLLMATVKWIKFLVGPSGEPPAAPPAPAIGSPGPTA